MGRFTGKTCRLSSMLALTFSYFLVELIVGHISHSLALVGDSYHMLSDVVALIVGLASVKISKMHSHKNTYGWARAEVLGALVNSVFLIALCFTVFIEAIQKLTTGNDHVDVDKIDLLLYVGIAGLVLNLIGLALFHHHSHGHSHGGGGGHGHSHSHKKKNKNQSNHTNHVKSEDVDGGMASTENESLHKPHDVGDVVAELDESSDSEECGGGASSDAVVVETSHGHSHDKKKKKNQSSAQLNMRGVFLHVMGDALGSVGVIVSALVIKFCTGDWRFYVDPALSMVMVMIISFTSARLMKESAFILLQTVPTHIQVSDLKEKLIKKVSGVLAVHEFHVWQLAGNRIIASAHIRCQTPHEYMRIAEEVKSFFHDEGIHSTTVQPEFVEFEEIAPDRDCVLECGPDKTCFVDTCCARKRVNITKPTQPFEEPSTQPLVSIPQTNCSSPAILITSSDVRLNRGSQELETNHSRGGKIVFDGTVSSNVSGPESSPKFTIGKIST